MLGGDGGGGGDMKKSGDEAENGACLIRKSFLTLILNNTI